MPRSCPGHASRRCLAPSRSSVATSGLYSLRSTTSRGWPRCYTPPGPRNDAGSTGFTRLGAGLAPLQDADRVGLSQAPTWRANATTCRLRASGHRTFYLQALHHASVQRPLLLLNSFSDPCQPSPPGSPELRRLGTSPPGSSLPPCQPTPPPTLQAACCSALHRLPAMPGTSTSPCQRHGASQ